MLLKNCFAFLARGSLLIYRIATIAVVVLGLGFLALVIGLRYVVLPQIDDYREPIAQALSRAVGQRVTIGSVSGSWRGYWPEMSFMDVKVLDAQGQPALAFDRVSGVLSWQSVPAAQWRFDSLAVDAPTLQVRRAADGVIWIAGIAIKPGNGGGGFGDWVLAQRQILVRDAAIVWLDEQRAAPALTLHKVNFRLERDGGVHRFGLTAVPPAQVASPLAARGEFAGQDMRSLQALNGKLFVEIDSVNLALAQEWIPVPFELASGSGSLRLWMELEGARVGAATADVRLVDVKTRLAADLPELALAALQGRLGWVQRGDRTEFSGASLGIAVAGGPRLAPMRFSYAYTTPAGGPRSSILRLSDFDLGPAAYLAHYLPLEPALRARLDRIEPAGTVQDAVVSWTGDWGSGPYSVKGQFVQLSVRPDGVLPGVRGASAQVDANERGGTIALNVTQGDFELPGVFAEPLPLDFLTASAKWTVRQGFVELAIRNASFTNEHLAGTVAGSYTAASQGRGAADLSGTLVRADAQQIWRYMPKALSAPQAWLKRALLAGEASDARFRLKGALKDFPFADNKNGIFELKTRASGVILDFAEGWPPISGVQGDLTFRGRRMDIRVQSAETLGVKLSGVRASIAELGKRDEHLIVEGMANGPTQDFLRYVSAMPNASAISRFTGEFKAAGDAALTLALDLPFHRIRETAVKGELRVQNNQVTLDSRLPPLERFGARIGFTEKNFTVTEGRALVFGAPLSFDAANQADGGIAANVAGTLDVDQARLLWKHPVLGFVDGRAPWRAAIGVRNKATTVRIESNLVGLRSMLPAPFSKAAAANLPLKVEMREQAAGQSVLSVDLDGAASALLLLERGAARGVRRGTISLGSPAVLPISDGLWIKGKLGIVDVDIWQRVLGESSTDAPPLLAGVDLQIGILDLNRRRFHDLRVDASRIDSEWRATLDGREVAGLLSWASAGGGKLIARFSKLVLPPVMTQVGTAASGPSDTTLPSVDLIAESFTYEGKELGRLTVQAQPQFSGWELRRLALTNPESKFVMQGEWAFGAESHTDVNVRLDVSDLGKFFARLGWPNAVKGGSATLEGPIQWRGNPTRFDIPSLSGQLKLEAKDGRFQEIEPGVAKLLGILSLQALPKRAFLDFRDVFSKGFSFDQISANVSVTTGLADTRDFLMQGSAARVAMRGQVDLDRETQNLVVRVTPSLSEGIAIAGAIVNPAIGVAALIAQKALKDPFSQFASFDYSVTGTWADPVIVRLTKSPPKEKQKGR